MSADLPALFAALDVLAEGLPEGAVEPLATAIAAVPAGNWALLAAASQRVLAAPQYREQLGAFLTVWQRTASELPPASVALALRAAAYTIARQRRAQHLELVWTGPASREPLRRTAQVLRELIDAAQQTLLVVSFAVYDIPEIGQALLRAAHRGVQIQLVIESAKESAGKLTYNSLAAFGAEVTRRAQIVRWPAEHRSTDAAGRAGALHAKCAVADAGVLLISSANLTHYALNLNMELGVLVRGGPLPRQVARHFAALIQQGTLAAYPTSG